MAENKVYQEYCGNLGASLNKKPNSILNKS